MGGQPGPPGSLHCPWGQGVVASPSRVPPPPSLSKSHPLSAGGSPAAVGEGGDQRPPEHPVQGFTIHICILKATFPKLTPGEFHFPLDTKKHPRPLTCILNTKAGPGWSQPRCLKHSVGRQTSRHPWSPRGRSHRGCDPSSLSRPLAWGPILGSQKLCVGAALLVLLCVDPYRAGPRPRQVGHTGSAWWSRAPGHHIAAAGCAPGKLGPREQGQSSWRSEGLPCPPTNRQHRVR